MIRDKKFISFRSVAAAVFAVAAVRFYLDKTSRIAKAVLVLRIIVDLRAKVYDKMQRLSFSFFDANASGSIINRVTSDVQAVRMFIDGVLIEVRGKVGEFVRRGDELFRVVDLRRLVVEAFVRATGHAPRVIFECVGVPGLLQQCIGMAPRNAQLVVAGICMQPDTIVPVAAAVKQLQLQFVAYYRRPDFALTLDMLGAGRIDPTPMVTDRVGLDGMPEAFEALRKPVGQCKVIVEP